MESVAIAIAMAPMCRQCTRLCDRQSTASNLAEGRLDVFKWGRLMLPAGGPGASVGWCRLDRSARESRGRLRAARRLVCAILLILPTTAAAQDFPPQFQLSPVTEAPQLTATTAIDLES